MAKKAKTSTSYVIRCVHCMTDEFKLTDVNLNETPKDYTDTPAKYRSKRAALPIPSKVSELKLGTEGLD